jgi:hypothetical protein
MKTVFAPIVQAHSTDTGMPMTVAALKGATAEGLALLSQAGSLGLAMARYAAKGGAVKLNYAPVGTLDLVDASTFSLTTNSAAQRMLDAGVVKTLAIELDERGEVRETWLADRDDMDRAVTKIAEIRFQKQLERERKPMTPEQSLEQAIQKCYSERLSLRDFGGGLRKDIAVSPGAYAKPIDEFNPRPAERQEVPPKGTINVAELARANQKIRVIGEHLRAAMRATPSSVSVGDAGLCWTALGVIGLGIDSRFVGGTQSVAVAPDGQSEYLQEAWAKVSDKAAGDLAFHKAHTKSRAQPFFISKSGGQVTFSKSADVPVSSDNVEAQQLLRRHAMETALAHMKILGDKLNAAVAANPDSPALQHLRAAQQAHQDATTHVNNCLKDEDER